MSGRLDGYAHIGTERRRRILTLTLQRPEQLNAANAEIHAELARIFVDARQDPDSDIVVLTGAGRAFCAGGDLEDAALDRRSVRVRADDP